MKGHIRLTLVLGLALGLAGLVAGTFGPTTEVRSTDSPYLSALSDFAVGSAEAVACNTHCHKVTNHPPYYDCQNDIEPTGMFCHYALDHTSCFNDVCP
jgi:hypothetical protein